MGDRLSPFEEFILLFNNMKAAVKDSPRRLHSFYDESKEIKDATRAFQFFLLETDFERRVFHGPRKLFVQAPLEFGKVWDDYTTRWVRALSAIELRELVPEWGLGQDFDSDAPAQSVESEPPDPETDDNFNPRWHDGGAALELGIDYLRSRAETDPLSDDDEWIINSCRIGSDAYDYLVKTIGLDIRSAFGRWRKVPVVFMPAHVSNRYGASDKGSLPHLLDDAVRAYVFGAPAAAIAMCRAAYHMVKRHYTHEELENVIVLASRRFDYSIKQLVGRANEVMHNYDNRRRLTAEDDRIILNFLATVKFFVEQAPKPQK
jgi:hypothetical protein